MPRRAARPTPLATFRVRPSRRTRLAVEVMVFADARVFRQFVKAESQRDGIYARTRGLCGQCCGQTEFKTRRVRKGAPWHRRQTGLFASVRLCRGFLGTSTIVHEVFHATLRWAARVGIAAVPTDKPGNNIQARRRRAFQLAQASIEERCATTHDELCRRIVNELYRRKILTI